jgi:photosystem II stability/assembly factor-like uncharacterized protein
MQRSLLLSIAAMLLALPCVAQDFWQKTAGPHDGPIWSLVTDSSGIVYLSSDAGFKSTDDGVTWQYTGAEALNMSWTELAGGESSGVLYSFFLGLPSGLLRSSDQGRLWTRLSTGGSSSPRVHALAAKPGIVFKSDDGLVMRYTHASGSWDAIPILPGGDRTAPENLVTAFTIAPDGMVFALTGAGVYRTSDDGNSWSTTSAIGDNRPARAIHADAGGVLYASTGDTLFRSTDAGTTWAPTSLDVFQARGVTISSKGSATIFVGTSNGMFARSTDAGATWSRDAASGMYPRTILVTRSGTLLVGSAYGGVFRSTDDGATWTTSNAGIAGSHASKLAVAPNGKIYAVGNSYIGDVESGIEASASIWTTTDRGESWRPQRLGFLGTCVSYSLIALGNNDVVLGAACGGVFLSTDDGSTWIDRSPSGVRSFSSIALLGNGDLLAATSGGLYRSGDNGRSWTPASAFKERINSLLAHSSGRIITGTRAGAFFVSTDNGMTWNRATSPTTGELISMTEGRGGRVFAASQSAGVFQSSDSGATWVKSGDRFSNGMNNDPTVFADRNGDVYLAGYDKSLLRTTDHGATWSVFASGLPKTITTGLARDSSGYLWIGVGGGAGIYRSTIATASVAVDAAGATVRSSDVRLAPNPLMRTATFSFTLRTGGDVQVRVYDPTGDIVSTVVDRSFEVGTHDVQWNAEDVAPGAYYYVLTAGGDVVSGAFIVR